MQIRPDHATYDCTGSGSGHEEGRRVGLSSGYNFASRSLIRLSVETESGRLFVLKRGRFFGTKKHEPLSTQRFTKERSEPA